MSENNNNTVPNEDIPQGSEVPNNGDKTFTQDEVNRIVSTRLGEERRKLEAVKTGEYAAELAERETNILQRELKMDARERLREAGLPPSVAKLLRYDDKETYNQSLEDTIAALSEAIDPAVDQRVREALSGTTPKVQPRFGSDPVKNAFAPKK